MNVKISPYSTHVEAQMVSFYNNLSERQRRHYAAVESEKLGYGGKAYIIRLFGLRRNTLVKGIYELEHPEANVLSMGSQRKSGGGRKKKRISS
jgi:hypothetical protein